MAKEGVEETEAFLERALFGAAPAYTGPTRDRLSTPTPIVPNPRLRTAIEIAMERSDDSDPNEETAEA